MRNIFYLNILCFLYLTCGPPAHHGPFSFHAERDRIDISHKNRPVTTFRFENSLPKPVLYPLFSPSGIPMTRDYPFIERKGESRDHPHHQGVFFTCDEVNETNFWGNTSVPPQIKHIATLKMDNDTITVLLHWISVHGQVLFKENRIMAFRALPDAWSIDFTITLTAVDTTVIINDTKEGMFAVRVADWLREKEGTGIYLNSQKQRSERQVWGKRAEWIRLQGKYNNRSAGITIFNHPESTNYPTFWMARGYGLFSANPIGQYVYQTHHKNANAEQLRLRLEPGENALFKFKLMCYEKDRSFSFWDTQSEEYKTNF